ncbi:hypothetical protein KY330_00925 [Candidatus Woesearchaeota archaeon]|nr:hypothetical protein [Candidatus Woesearchaeota archaeon]
MKKGQITIYIILGIVILAIVGALLFFRTTDTGVAETLSLDAARAEVEQYVKTCIKTEGDYVLLALGYQGGYLFTPSFGGINYEGYTAAYDYYLGYNMLPSVNEIEDLHIDDFLDLTLLECVNDLDVFADRGVGIETGALDVNSEINYGDVLITVNYPVTLVQGDSVVELESFSEKFPIRLGYILAQVDELIEKEVDDPNWVDLTYINDLELDVRVVPISQTENLYFVTDEMSILKNQPYVFVFGNKFTDNHPPYLDIIPDVSLRLGESYTYTVNAVDFDDDEITYSDDSMLFDITEEGEISFTATRPIFEVVTITATDVNGFIDTQQFFIEVS